VYQNTAYSLSKIEHFVIFFPIEIIISRSLKFCDSFLGYANNSVYVVVTIFLGLKHMCDSYAIMFLGNLKRNDRQVKIV